MFRSATFKLTVWYILLATSLCLLFSVVLYHFSTDELSEALNHQYSTFEGNDHDSDNIPLPQSEIRRHARHLLEELVWLNIVVISGSSIAGFFLARRTLQPIEVAHKAQTRFTAEASHELRTPLAAMRADTEVALMERGLPAKIRRTLQGNVRDIERLERLTGRLLDIARYQNKTVAEPQLLDLDELVQQAVVQLKHAVQTKHIYIKQDIRPVQIVGEESGLQQLVTIVLDNAIKYGNDQGTITLSLTADDTDALLLVKDDGIGIPADDLPHVFERFYRSSNAKSDKKMANGYGLGLPLALEIAKAHNGNVSIDSREGSGTTVRIMLPIAHTQ